MFFLNRKLMPASARRKEDDSLARKSLEKMASEKSLNRRGPVQLRSCRLCLCAIETRMLGRSHGATHGHLEQSGMCVAYMELGMEEQSTNCFDLSRRLLMRCESIQQQITGMEVFFPQSRRSRKASIGSGCRMRSSCRSSSRGDAAKYEDLQHFILFLWLRTRCLIA
jgi:hypothetical protein